MDRQANRPARLTFADVRRRYPGHIVIRIVKRRDDRRMDVRFAAVPISRAQSRSSVLPLFPLGDMDGMTINLSPMPVNAVAASVPHYPVEIPDEKQKARMVAATRRR